MKFFKRKKTEDEWLVQTKNQIFAEIYFIVVLIAVISFIVKYFFLHQSFQNVVTELVLLLAIGVYYGFRSVQLGVHAAEIELKERKRKHASLKYNLVIALAVGFVIALAFGLHSAIRYAEGMAQMATYFVVTFFASLVIYMPISILFIVWFNEMIERKSKRIAEEMLADDAPGDDDEKY